MNRNTGSVKTFTVAHFPREQAFPINMGYVRSNSVVESTEIVANIKNTDLEAVSANGQEVLDVFIIATVAAQNAGAHKNVSKIRLNKQYRMIKLNQNTTRIVVTGFFE